MRQGKEKSIYSIEPLGKQHDRAVFYCGKEVLDRYIKEQASQDVKRHYAASFVLVRNREISILGYYTLSSFGIKLGDLPEKTRQELPRYPIVPATLLGRLAVDKNHRGKGLGEYLLMDALHRSLKQVDMIGSVAVVVEAKDEDAVQFYKSYEFMPYADRPDRLFLPMKTIRKLF